MHALEQQQIIISGVGGQGVLFVTRLLADAAIRQGLPVFTSETHGMAQRGGTVLSHLKIGPFSSPLIRPGRADGLIALRAESLGLHGEYVAADGWIVANGASAPSPGAHTVDADGIAARIGNRRAVNLITLGFALGRLPADGEVCRGLFCSIQTIQTVVQMRLEAKPALLQASLQALQAGFEAAVS